MLELVEANQNHIKQYVLRHARLPDIRYTQGRLPKAASSVQLIAKVLRQQGILCGSIPISEADAWLIRFDNHLMRVHGLSRESRLAYIRHARRILQSLQMSEPDWSVLTAQHICDFVCGEAARVKPGPLPATNCRDPGTVAFLGRRRSHTFERASSHSRHP